MRTTVDRSATFEHFKVYLRKARGTSSVLGHRAHEMTRRYISGVVVEGRGMANMMVLSQDEALEFVAFLVTGARCLMDEAVDYGPMRLLEAAERLCRWVAPRSDNAAVPRKQSWPRRCSGISRNHRHGAGRMTAPVPLRRSPKQPRDGRMPTNVVLAPDRTINRHLRRHRPNDWGPDRSPRTRRGRCFRARSLPHRVVSCTRPHGASWTNRLCSAG